MDFPVVDLLREQIEFCCMLMREGSQLKSAAAERDDEAILHRMLAQAERGYTGTDAERRRESMRKLVQEAIDRMQRSLEAIEELAKHFGDRAQDLPERTLQAYSHMTIQQKAIWIAELRATGAFEK